MPFSEILRKKKRELEKRCLPTREGEEKEGERKEWNDLFLQDRWGNERARLFTGGVAGEREGGKLSWLVYHAEKKEGNGPCSCYLLIKTRGGGGGGKGENFELISIRKEKERGNDAGGTVRKRATTMLLPEGGKKGERT